MSLKKSIKKSVAAFIAISLLYSNCYLCGFGISKAIAQDIKEPDIELNLENLQYVQFKEEIEKDSETEKTETEEIEKSEIEYYSGVAIKTKMQVGIEAQETQLPIKSAELSISLPVLNGYLPERANMVAADTLISTGEENNNKINQNYDSNSGLLNVSYQNEQAYSNYNQELKDEFEIIYIYQAEAYTGNEEEISLQYTANSKLIFETENGEITSEKTQSFELKEKDNKGDLLEFTVTELENSIYKGFMYSNVEHGTTYNTDYDTVSTLCVLNSNTANDLTMEIKENNFVLNDEENTEISAEGKTIYKATEIRKEEFDKILGQEGILEIYSEETLLATVKYIDVSENEEIIKRLAIIHSDENIKILSPEETIAKVEYSEDITNLLIKTTKPVAEGYINFKNENTIKASEEHVTNVEEIKSIKTTSVVNENVKTTELLLLEPETKISVNSSNVNFSTLQTNKTTLTIKLDSTNASTKLFNNPTITIKLPDGLTGGNLSSPEIVNGNGLNIKNASANGNIITIELEGAQTTYDLTNVSGGATIVMDIENIDFEDTLPTHTDSIVVTCAQNDEEVKVKQDVNIISKEGLLVLSNLSGFNNEGSVLTSIDSELKTVDVNINEEQKELVRTIDLVNNYDKNITNVEIIGRLGYINENLNSNFDLNLSKPIEVANGKVYYSANKNASYNDETWTEEFTAEAKAYKIEINNKELASKDSFSIKSYLNLPANLYYNKESYIKTDINYIYDERNLSDSSTIGILTQKNDLANNSMDYSVSLMSEEGNNNPVSVIVTPNITKDYVHSGQTVTYNIKITNNGTQELNNINVEDIIPDNAIYTYAIEKQGATANYIEIVKDTSIKNKSWSIESLKPGESANYEIMLTMAEVSEEQEILNTVKITCNNQTVVAESKLILKPAKIEIALITNAEGLINNVYDSGDQLEYYIKVNSKTEENLKNIKVKFQLPEHLEYISGGVATYDEFEGYIIDESTSIIISNNTFEYTIDKLKAQEEMVIAVKVRVKELTNSMEAQIVAISQAELDGDIYESNIKTIKTEQSSFAASLMCNVNGQSVLKQNDEVIYSIEVQNFGLTSGIITIKDNIPEQLEVTKIEEYINDELETSIETSKQNTEWQTNIEQGEKLTLKIYTKVGLIEVEEQKNINATNKATVIFNGKEIVTNEIVISIQPELIIENEEEFDTEDEYYEEERPEPEEEEDEDFTSGDKTENEDTNTEIEDNNNMENDGSALEGEEDSKENEDADTENDNNDTDDENTDDKDNNTESNDPEQEESEGESSETTPDDNENNQTEQITTYTISGIAWLDLDKNGTRSNNETILQNITVSLINMNVGNFATDTNGNRITTTTDAQGKYMFNNIPKGSYAVMFEFDTNNYTVTTYQKAGVSETENSDAILSTVTVDGQTKNVGITDKIELSSNKENVDLGLMQNAIFDLSLNKQITKITVVDKQGTETYEYEDGHTAKVDLVAKYMNGANVIVTYKFTVTNQGDITGYVDSLVDTLPSGLEFSSELNSDWYKDSNGNLYNTSLSGVAIKPGESKEVELILTKVMTEDNAGTFVNSARLEKISNLENINEKEETIENNESSAILFISIKTGSIILYIGITLISLSIIGFGAYLINKKVLNRGI